MIRIELITSVLRDPEYGAILGSYEKKLVDSLRRTYPNLKLNSLEGSKLDFLLVNDANDDFDVFVNICNIMHIMKVGGFIIGNNYDINYSVINELFPYAWRNKDYWMTRV